MKPKIRMMFFLSQETDTRNGQSLGLVLNNMSVITDQSQMAVGSCKLFLLNGYSCRRGVVGYFSYSNAMLQSCCRATLCQGQKLSHLALHQVKKGCRRSRDGINPRLLLGNVSIKVGATHQQKTAVSET